MEDLGSIPGSSNSGKELFFKIILSDSVKLFFGYTATNISIFV